MKPNLFKICHFKDNQGIVVEEVPSTNDCEVGEEITEAFQACHTEQQQIVSDDSELWEAEVAVILCFGDEQDLQETLDHRAVLQALQLMDIIANVDIWPANFPICWPQTKCGEDEQEPPDDGEGPSSSARLHSSFFNWTKTPFPKTKQNKKKSKIVRFLSSPRPLKITSGGGEAGQGK